MIQITLDELQELLACAVDAGLQKFEQGRNPNGDRIRRGEAERFLRMRGLKPVMLKRWTDARLLTAVKTGERQNSPTYYSFADIKRVLATEKLKSVCNR